MSDKNKPCLMTLALLALAVSSSPTRAQASWLLPGGTDGLRLDTDDDRDEQAKDKEKEKEKLRAEERARERETRLRDRDGDERLYERGLRYLDERQWDRAASTFAEVAGRDGSRADAALYWKAYAQNKVGQRSEALATLAELSKSYPQSRWLNDTKALEVEVRQASGQAVAPENEDSDELKLMALNALVNTDSERALPLLEKLLLGAGPPKLKERALFVLCQSGSARAREIVVKIARGQANPDLQMRAINSLGVFGGAESKQALSDVYAASKDVNVKKAVLRAFMVSGERERLLQAAKGETAPELRAEAIRQLGVMGAQKELSELYQAEASPDLRKSLIQAFFVGGNSEKLLELARSEKDADVRRRAVRNLGLMNSRRTGEALVSIYESDKDPDIRREVLQALFIQSNAKSLIDIARKETDPTLKKAAVGKLSVMKSKEATDFMIELLNK